MLELRRQLEKLWNSHDHSNEYNHHVFSHGTSLNWPLYFEVLSTYYNVMPSPMQAQVSGERIYHPRTFARLDAHIKMPTGAESSRTIIAQYPNQPRSHEQAETRQRECRNPRLPIPRLFLHDFCWEQGARRLPSTRFYSESLTFCF
jgi:hypothetical protein